MFDFIVSLLLLGLGVILSVEGLINENLLHLLMGVADIILSGFVFTTRK